MNDETIQHCSEERQEYLSWMRDMIDEYSVDMIYCPMCEVTHENNSNCQRND